jgi:hypothetical protein
VTCFNPRWYSSTPQDSSANLRRASSAMPTWLVAQCVVSPFGPTPRNTRTTPNSGSPTSVPAAAIGWADTATAGLWATRTLRLAGRRVTNTHPNARTVFRLSTLADKPATVANRAAS